MDNNYIKVNQALWEAKTAVHVTSDFYEQELFLQGKNTLQAIELAQLGDIDKKTVLHLQCHFGQDSLSLARMGATVTGIDFSEKAIQIANETAQRLSLNAQFICCNVYDTLQHIREPFDIVFTTYGVIGWLEDLDAWAKVIAGSLKRGGELHFVEFHPVVWMYDNDFTHIAYPYFKDVPIIENESGTYANRQAPIQLTSVSWNHGLAEVVTALLNNGLVLTQFREFDYSPYNCFNNMKQGENGQYFIPRLEKKIPMVYAIKAVKK
ncbi:MAG: class I SAM-dependent methyltransferase [Saprospiraceae bacterium]|nr:class I SAM-dependent methyltransferase [Saprospiraceae bacterium]MBP7679477.1 class I SAM-dependent methyltransferase [Saprospiraceae bacterium]